MLGKPERSASPLPAFGPLLSVRMSWASCLRDGTDCIQGLDGASEPRFVKALSRRRSARSIAGDWQPALRKTLPRLPDSSSAAKTSGRFPPKSSDRRENPPPHRRGHKPAASAAEVLARTPEVRPRRCCPTARRRPPPALGEGLGQFRDLRRSSKPPDRIGTTGSHVANILARMRSNVSPSLIR